VLAAQAQHAADARLGGPVEGAVDLVERPAAVGQVPHRVESVAAERGSGRQARPAVGPRDHVDHAHRRRERRRAAQEDVLAGPCRGGDLEDDPGHGGTGVVWRGMSHGGKGSFPPLTGP